MHMLWHDDIARNLEVIELSSGLQNRLEDGFGFGRLQIRESIVATEGDEVMLAKGLVAMKPGGHGRSLLRSDEQRATHLK